MSIDTQQAIGPLLFFSCTPFFPSGNTVPAVSSHSCAEDFTKAISYGFPRDYAAYNNRGILSLSVSVISLSSICLLISSAAWCYENNGASEQALSDYYDGTAAPTAGP